MASSMLIKVTCLSVMCLVLAIPLANAGPYCRDVVETILPCIEYITTPGASTLPAPCCNGMKSLNGEPQYVCRCLKETFFVLPGLNLAALAALPKNCGVNLPYQITPDMNCDKVN
ncbi:putative plant lipid transfer protein/Par allergen [Medicago truncatula]|uniref:Non-specific lipid-transfer protein n=1 Tax=Medicago truncatula TaxID=3880 RepID=A0A396H4L7_MEDTR|nr:non-specific lipid-transfer protein [Medicago truncatula]RHN46664.1 putative plant lipid transfer protein/Par allergen [Medicago truncatula]